MRCGCDACGAFMIHAEDKPVCVCPECGTRCDACLGTNSVVDRAHLKELAQRKLGAWDGDNAPDGQADGEEGASWK